MVKEMTMSVLMHVAMSIPTWGVTVSPRSGLPLSCAHSSKGCGSRVIPWHKPQEASLPWVTKWERKVEASLHQWGSGMAGAGIPMLWYGCWGRD